MREKDHAKSLEIERSASALNTFLLIEFFELKWQKVILFALITSVI